MLLFANILLSHRLEPLSSRRVSVENVQDRRRSLREKASHKTYDETRYCQVHLSSRELALLGLKMCREKSMSLHDWSRVSTVMFASYINTKHTYAALPAVLVYSVDATTWL